MYKRDIWTFRDSMEVEEKHTGRYGAPGQKREKKKKATPEQIKKQNQWMKVRKVRRLIKWNFSEGDYWLTFTYRPADRPKNMEAAKKDMSNLLNRLKYHYKKQDKQLKWILKMEQGARGAIHAHMILNRIDGGDLLLARQWKKGRVHMQLLYEEGGFQDLAEYIAKKSDSSQGEPYSRSRNMIEHDPETKVMKRRTWQKEIKPPKGYYVDKTSVIEGINPVTGYPYRYYTLIKIGGDTSVQGKHIHRGG